MKSDWNDVKLGDVCALLYGKSLPERVRVPGSIPVFGSSGITGTHERPLVKGPGIIIGRKGTVGSVYWSQGDFFPIDTVYYVENNKEDSSLRFLYYLLGSIGLEEMNSDAAVPGLNRSNALSVRILIPPIKTQQKIAGILSAYDELIENNLKRIKLLEEKAHQTYEEWFVRMRFPGHESTPIDPDSGLPEGWVKCSYFDVLDIMSGGTPKTSVADYWGGEIPFFTPKDAEPSVYVRDTQKSITRQGLEKCNSQLYPKGTVFITARGTVGKVNMASRDMAMNQSCYALRGKENLSSAFVYYSIKTSVDAFLGVASGGVFDTIIIDTFKFLTVVLPSKDLITSFKASADTIHQAIFDLTEQNAILEEARDILLPRLMTGIIDVEELDVEVPIKA